MKKAKIILYIKNKLNLDLIKKLRTDIESLKSELNNKIDNTEFNDYKILINNKFINYDTKLKELEDLVNLDEETIRQIKEIIANLPDYQDLLNKINRINTIVITSVYNGTYKSSELGKIRSINFSENFAKDLNPQDAPFISLTLSDYINNGLVTDIKGSGGIVSTPTENSNKEENE